MTTTGDATVGGNAQVDGTLGVAGETTTNGITNTGNVGTGTLTTTGDATVGGNAQVDGTLGVAGETTTNGITNTGNLTNNGQTVLNGGLTVAPEQVVSFGNNRLRDIAAPIAGTDATNKNYVDAADLALNNRINDAFGEIDENTQGIAIAIAMGGLALPTDKNFAISATLGIYDNKTAIAAQAALRIDKTYTLNGGIGFGTDANSKVGGRIGITAAW